MSERVIPLVDARQPALAAPRPATPIAATGRLHDARGRPLRDLRISVTDRCNFRCTYCMPKEVFDKDYRYLRHADLLSFEEIARLARAFVAHGVRKIRLTGGEPLLRRHLHRLIEMLAALRTPEGAPLDLTLTTNGALLARQAQSLKDAGLQRVTVSLDGLDDAVFRRMNDVDFPVTDVLAGIDAARAVGLGRDAAGRLSGLKVNMVVQRSVNLNQVLPMTRHFRDSGISLRFIEYMDVGTTNGWRMDEVVPSADLRRLIASEFPLVRLPARDSGETAERWGHADAQGCVDPALGELGFISSVTQAFCGDCNRARISMEGRLYLCLFAAQGHDLRALLRDTDAPADDADLASAIGHLWQQRSDRYSELRAGMSADTQRSAPRVEMSYIGG